MNKRILFLRIIHFGFVSGVLFFTIIVFFITPNLKMSYQSDNIFYVFPILFSALTIIYHNKPFLSQVKKIRNKDSIQSKFAKYQTAHIFRLMIIEVAALINIIGALLTENLLLLLLTIILLVLMIYYKPSLNRVKEELNLNQSELNQFKT